MKRALLLLVLALTLPAWSRSFPQGAQIAQEPHCDCPPGMRHLCRCGVLIDLDVADIQLAYLKRLLKAEFGDQVKESPVTSIRLAPPEEMVLKGEAAQGYYDNGALVLNDTLRRDQALMVIAHELGHAWQFSEQPNPNAISDFMAEGFADWVSFHLMKRAGMTEFCYNLRHNPDPLYGAACRWYLSVEEKYGSDAVLDIMRTWVDKTGKKAPSH